MKLLLIQFRTDASTEHEYRCVLTHGGLRPAEVVRVNPIQQPGSVRAVQVNDVDGIILGGSGEFSLVNDQQVRSAVDEVRPLLDAVLAADHPFFGMCFGHQVLAWHLGAWVETDPAHSQVGTYPVRLTIHGQDDPLFADVPVEFPAQHGHKDSVVELPKGAIHLAQGVKNPIGAYRVGRNVYATQFHPELTKADLMTRLELYPEYLKGKTLVEAAKDFDESPEAPKVLRNFIDGVRRRNAV